MPNISGGVSGLIYFVTGNEKGPGLMPGAFLCSMVAARAREIYDRDAKERQKAAQNNDAARAVRANLPELDKGQARDQAGKGEDGRT